MKQLILHEVVNVESIDVVYTNSSTGEPLNVQEIAITDKSGEVFDIILYMAEEEDAES